MEEYTLGYNSYPYRRSYPTDMEAENLWLKGWHDAREQVNLSAIDGPDGNDSWLVDY